MEGPPLPLRTAQSRRTVRCGSAVSIGCSIIVCGWPAEKNLAWIYTERLQFSEGELKVAMHAFIFMGGKFSERRGDTGSCVGAGMEEREW